jgi:nucleoside-diphosphate-sugar epimerase
MIKKISIAGCGWLGLPLGESLAKKGYSLKGSTTTAAKLEKIEMAGITPFLINFDKAADLINEDAFFDADLMIIAIPPSKTAHYSHTIYNIVHRLPKECRVIFISSTSVYDDLNRVVDESDAKSGQIGNAEIYLAEQEILKKFTDKSCILRCGGLMGKERVAGKYFAAKKGLNNGHLILNLIHYRDVIGIIEKIIEKDAFGKVWNLVAPMQRSRKEVYEQNAYDYGFSPPEFTYNDLSLPFKIISPQKLLNELQYSFKFPDPKFFQN